MRRAGPFVSGRFAPDAQGEWGRAGAYRVVVKFLNVLILGVLVLGGAVVWISWSVDSARTATQTLCSVTRPGEPLSQVSERAREHGLTLQRQSAPGAVPEEHLAESSSMSRRFGCTLVVQGGRVIDKRAGELPSR